MSSASICKSRSRPNMCTATFERCTVRAKYNNDATTQCPTTLVKDIDSDYYKTPLRNNEITYSKDQGEVKAVTVYNLNDQLIKNRSNFHDD